MTSPGLERDLLCPLCDYNLRGLSDPRCPECGHQFDWAELIDEARWHHPWLFEHQRKRGIRAWFATFFASFVPSRFWASVKPTHPPRPFRLFVYWLVPALLAGLVMAAPVIGRIIITQRGVTPMPLGRGLRMLGGQANLQLRVLVPAGLMYLCWPGLTLLVLMIFRQTMRQARIKSDHVVRCVVYSSDVLILMALPLWLVVAAMIDAGYSGRLSGWMFVGPLFEPPVVLVLVVALAALTWRLAAAYRLYLRFPAAAVTCILSQVVVALAMLTGYMLWVTRNWR
jgi:hypothetical protein